MKISDHHLEYHGTDEAFAVMLVGAGITEPVLDHGIGEKVVHLRSGANIHWWPSRGTIHVDGTPRAAVACKELLRNQPGVIARKSSKKRPRTA